MFRVIAVLYEIEHILNTFFRHIASLKGKHQDLRRGAKSM
jgi:hypothetical protein